MPKTIWTELSSLQLGKYAEYYAKMEFTSYGFDVYTSEVDDHGVDFIAKSKDGVFYEVQVKSVRKNNYTFILQNKIKLDDTHLICYIQFVDGKAPECFVIPATVFKKPDGSLFICRDYTGLKSKPEYGISVTKKNKDMLNDYSAEKMLNYLIRNS